ncbi:hypothetical protein [Microcoleus anatoxicus]|uniref:Uncharacterized protein n=1 Tax=Microcoleus anatoxicus PTRS2 TaxID=2705321 RepID=A0ABU8YUI9_9CYAN
MRRGFQPPADCATKQTNFRSVSGRSNLREMYDRVFWMDVRSHFWVDGRSVFLVDGRSGFLGGWAIAFLGGWGDRAIIQKT